MDKELFRKIEGRLYRYFRSKRKIRDLNRENTLLENKQNQIENDIKNANVTIDYYQNGIGLSERVQTSSTGISYAESEICRAIGDLEREHSRNTIKILKNKSKIRELESFVEHMNNNIGQLQEEDKRFLELKYGDNKNLLQVSIKLNMSKTTAYRKREELIENIAEYDNNMKMWEKVGKKSGLSKQCNAI